LPGLADPQVLFVKGEPHSAKKLAAKRYRRIHNLSFVDSLIRAIAHVQYNHSLIDVYQAAHFGDVVALGIGHHDVGLEKIARTLERQMATGGVASMDAEGWDASLMEDHLATATDVRIAAVERCTGDYVWWYKRLLRVLCHLDNRHLLLLGQTLVVNDQAGMLASGHASTSANNSIVRTNTFRAAWYRRKGFCNRTTAATGDDLTVATYGLDIDDVLETLSAWGINTKPGSLTVGTPLTSSGVPVAEYTSHAFYRSVENGRPSYRVEYMNSAKTLNRFLTKSAYTDGSLHYDTDAADGVAFVLRNTQRESRWFREFIESMDPDAELREVYCPGV